MRDYPLIIGMRDYPLLWGAHHQAMPHGRVLLGAGSMALLLLLVATASAHAQLGGGHGRRQRDQQQTPQTSQAPKPLPARPEIWPRLEGGALICKSRDDLVRYQTQIANSASATTQRDRRPTAIPSRSRRAFRFWITTVRRAPKLSRRTSPKRPGGPIATCHRPRRLLSPKAPAP